MREEPGMDEVTVWHNPRCSKSRGACALLAEHGIEPQVRRYLDDPPSRDELEEVLGLLGTDDPRQIMRTTDPRYRELGLGSADRERLLEVLVAEPGLIERPIVIRDGVAVVARPPELLLALLTE